MIYTCIADGIRSPPAFFLKNKYKEPMKMQNENTKRVWLYARIPGNDGETLRCIRECAAKAQQDNCKIVGTSADERYGWLLRPGYREMMRQVKAGEIDCIYIYRMRQISGKEQHLFRFFQQVMRYGIKVVTLEYSLRDRLHEYRLGMKIENYAARHKLSSYYKVVVIRVPLQGQNATIDKVLWIGLNLLPQDGFGKAPTTALCF